MKRFTERYGEDHSINEQDLFDERRTPCMC